MCANAAGQNISIRSKSQVIFEKQNAILEQVKTKAGKLARRAAGRHATALQVTPTQMLAAYEGATDNNFFFKLLHSMSLAETKTAHKRVHAVLLGKVTEESAMDRNKTFEERKVLLRAAREHFAAANTPTNMDGVDSKLGLLADEERKAALAKPEEAGKNGKEEEQEGVKAKPKAAEEDVESKAVKALETVLKNLTKIKEGAPAAVKLGPAVEKLKAAFKAASAEEQKGLLTDAGVL
ncbi:MAG: hypothetical protein WC759_03525, partial [Candidatus Micrarchaeia archaeon]